MLGTVFGIGAFVAILGLTATAGGQISRQFSILDATQVTVTDVGATASSAPVLDFPPDAGARVDALHGAVGAGVYWQVQLGDQGVSATPGAPSGQASSLDLYAASPGLLAAIDPTMSAGTIFNSFHEKRMEQVAV
ncbi:MAG: ABC transporter permease, partial [Acidimicrobiales bacterium]